MKSLTSCHRSCNEGKKWNGGQMSSMTERLKTEIHKSQALNFFFLNIYKWIQVSLILTRFRIAWYWTFVWLWNHLEYRFFLNSLSWLELSMICRWNREKKYTIMKIESCSLKDRDWRERPFWFDGRNTIRIGNKGYWDTHGVHECIRRFVIIFTASTPSHEYTIARWIWRDLISVQRRVNNLSLLTIMNFRQFRVHGESSFII